MISTNTPTDHLFYVLFRNYWKTQGAIWGPVLRDLTGIVNEAHISIYFRIYLFRALCSGHMSLAELAIGSNRRREREEGGTQGRWQPSTKWLQEHRLLPPLQGLHLSALILSG